MKHIEFKTIKGEFVVIELYDTIDKTSLSLDNGFLTYRDHIGWDGMRIMDSDCINLGCIQDITEEQAKEVVENHILFEPHSQITHKELFFDYMADVFSYTYTALESLHSLLEANGVDKDLPNTYIFKKK